MEGPYGLPVKFYQIFKEGIIPVFQTLQENREG